MHHSSYLLPPISHSVSFLLAHRSLYLHQVLDNVEGTLGAVFKTVFALFLTLDIPMYFIVLRHSVLNLCGIHVADLSSPSFILATVLLLCLFATVTNPIPDPFLNFRRFLASASRHLLHVTHSNPNPFFNPHFAFRYCYSVSSPRSHCCCKFTVQGTITLKWC